MKAFRLLAAALVWFASPALRAGIFSTTAWTDDASSGITNGSTAWAYHFGSTTPATVNSVTVTGFAGPNASDSNFDLTGMSNVFNGDTNNLTGTGSTVMGHDFVFGGNPANVTVKGLTVGTTYTVTFLSVGWDTTLGVRMITFASGSDSRLVDQSQFGDNNGIRIDYTFTATATTRLITLTPQNASFRFHLYGLALRPEAAPTTVTSTADSGTGSLRWALTNAKERTGADTVTFAPALSGQTITLGSEIVIDDATGVTLDASSLPGGITLSGGNARRLLSLSSGSIVTLRSLTLTGGNAVGTFDSGRGGAIYSNNATLTLDRCTLHGNAASSASGDGGALFANFGTVTLTNCTLAGNTAGFRGGALFTKAPLTLTHCTITQNGTTSTNPNTSGGGGIYDEFVALTLQNSIVAGNSVGVGVPDGKDILCNGGSVTRQGANLVQDYVDFGGTTTSGPAFTTGAPNLAALASNGGPTQTMLPNGGSPAINAAVGSTAATDQRGLSRPQGGTADIGAVETVPGTGLVVQNNADSGPGSLRQTLADAALSPGADTVTFVPGLSGQTITLTNGQLSLGSDVTIDASALASPVIISGNSDGDTTLEPGESRIFDIPAGITVVLRRLNLINGMAGGGSGGAIANAGQLTVDQCAISACRALQGGGIYNNFGTLTLTQSTLSGNSAIQGGGIYNFGTLTLTQSTLSGNSASNQGGGIYNDAGTLTLTQSTLSGNSASQGGGIRNFGGTLTLTQSTLSGNTANFDGGGIYSPGGTLTLNRSIVAGNTANVDANIFGSISSGTNNLTSGDPRLAPLGNYGGPTQTRPPLPGSPALDAGGGTTDTTDQRGLTRVVDADGNGTATVDIGAVELQVRLVTTTADENDGLGVNGVSLREAVADASGGSDIIRFAPGLNGQTLTLGGTHLSLARGPLLIDGSTLPGGITLSGGSNGDNVLDPGESRIFEIPAGVTVVLRRLNLINGIAGNHVGGAIVSSGQLTVDQCAISACRAGFGGGIVNNGGTLTLTQSTLSGNTASSSGGGIYTNFGTLTLTQSTLSGNSASSTGGGIYILGGTLTLTQSTLSGNSASSFGGGIYNSNGTLTLTRSIVAGNTAPNYANIADFGSSSGTNNLTDVDPLLARLGNYGGPTQTMPPLPGSPAIDAGGITTETTDQRGAPRVADGDGNGSAVVDIGAVEVTPTIVTSLSDSGLGSLRAALADPFTSTVFFAPALAGGTLTLTNGQLSLSRSVGIDASGVSGGITISGNSNGDATPDAGESRLFEIPAGVSVVLRGLHLINGIADPASNSATGEGGAIRNSGQLTLDLCAISNCRSRRGGAINSTGILTVSRSSFQQNNATFGGAIHSTDNGLLRVANSTFLMNTAGDRGGAVLENDVDSPAGHRTFTRCTFHGNAAARGGAVYSFGLTNLLHCTLSANSASNVGGGVQASNTSVVTLTNCLVAGNSNGSSPDLGFDGGGVLTTFGVNLVGDLTGSGLSAGPTLLTGDPLLAPIADYGGPTLTRALLPGSPARNAGSTFLDSADQRGFPVVGTPDLGAYEAGTLNSFGAFAAETPGAALSPTGDADGDGRSDLLEYATQSDPRAPNSGELPTTTYDQNATGAITQANVTFPTRVGATDLIYTLQHSTTLTGGWATVATWNATTGVLSQASGVSASRSPSTGLVSVADANVSGTNRAFYRLNVTQP